MARTQVQHMVLKYKDMHAFDNYKTMKIIYSMHRAGEVSVHRACCERATQPYSIGRGGTIYPGSRPAGVTTRSPRMVTEFLLTRSMLIKFIYIVTTTFETGLEFVLENVDPFVKRGKKMKRERSGTDTIEFHILS